MSVSIETGDGVPDFCFETQFRLQLTEMFFLHSTKLWSAPTRSQYRKAAYFSKMDIRISQIFCLLLTKMFQPPFLLFCVQEFLIGRLKYIFFNWAQYPNFYFVFRRETILSNEIRHHVGIQLLWTASAVKNTRLLDLSILTFMLSPVS